MAEIKMNEKYNLIFHHVGCLTNSIEDSKKTYSTIGFSSSQTYNISAQQVKVCFIETGPGIFIELVEPTASVPFFDNLLKSKNPFYHIAYLTENFEEVLQNLQSDGFRLVNTFNSEAFQNKKCAFLYSPEMQLIELVQK